MCHAALEQLFTLAGGLFGADGGRNVKIPGTYWTANMGCRYRTPVHPVGDVAIIELPRDSPSRAL